MRKEPDKPKAFGRHFHLPNRLVDRVGYIRTYCKGKRVLHLGCADYDSTGDWQQVLDSDLWLHRKLEQVAQEVIGIDIDEDAIKILQDRHGIKNVFVGDVHYLERLGKGKFDVIIAGEIIEHLVCPGTFLKSAHHVLNKHGELIITTTNAYCLRRFMRIPFGIESIHGDHVAYYSHKTLKRLAEICGFTVIDQCAYRLPRIKPFIVYVIEVIASRVSPNFCEGIVCRLKRSS